MLPSSPTAKIDSYPSNAVATSVALWPPNPKELLSATRTFFSRAYDLKGNLASRTDNNERDDSYIGDAFAYDLADQVTAAQLNVQGIWSVHPTPTIVYDANGNRTSFAPYGTTDTYLTNNLNQYSSRDGINASYDTTGNMTTGLDSSAYAYDAQNRLISASKNGTTESFKYDALNRVVSRTINGASFYNVWDGWNLIITYNATNAWQHAYFHGPDGMFLDYNVVPFIFETCFNDASGSTTHISDGGTLLEWYRYDLDGTPIIYDGNNNPRTSSAYDVRFLFTGQQWYSELGLYDLRNRFYSPDIGRFLQPDPIGFGGDATNLYRYCGNNPLKRSDPTGTNITRAEGGDAMRGDAFDYGYWGSNGTGTVYFGMTGRDGEDSTIFNNPYFTDDQVATISQLNGFSGFDLSGIPTFNASWTEDGLTVMRAQPVSGTIGFTGFGGEGTNTQTGNLGFVNLLNALNGTTYDRNHELYALGDIATMVDANPDAQVNILGYSRGAEAAVQLAGDLGAFHITVDNMILVDAVGKPPSSFTAPGNVTDALAIFQQNKLPKGTPLNPGANITNIDYTGVPGVNHGNIITIAAPIILKWL